MKSRTEITSVAALEQASVRASSPEERLQVIRDILRFYPTLPEAEADSQRRLRCALLTTLRQVPSDVIDEGVAHFIAENIQPDDFTSVRWRDPQDVVNYCEMLYGFQYPSDAATEKVHQYVRQVLTDALLQFEQRGEIEKLFNLMQLAPTEPQMEDRELRRLRSRAYLYEMRRVQRIRRGLYIYLILQAILVLLVFPWLFISAENGVIQAEIEQATKLNLPNEEPHFYTFLDGMYWSVITAASIGYGDVTPQSSIGKILAAVLGVMGVITIGVITGLILEWVTPRRIDS